MPQTKHYDLIVIGSGPGGYVGAIRAAQLGLKTACVERNKLGGVCLNWGCIPSKALLHNAELFQEAIVHGKEWGIMVDPEKVEVDWSKVIGRSRKITGSLNSGVGFLFKKNKIDHYEGHAKITGGRTAAGPCTIEISEPDEDYYRGSGGKTVGTLTANNIVIATGARPNDLPFAPCDGDRILSSYDALAIPEQPETMVIVGSGAIGMEFAYFFNAFGTQVTVVELVDRILPAEDDDISKAAEKSFSRQGIVFKTATTVTDIKTTRSGAKVQIASADGKGETLDCERVLVAIGVTARFDGLFDESLGMRVEKGHIWTDYRDIPEPTYATSVPGVYAIGDVIGPPWLAHVGSEEAIACVERIAGHDVMPIDYDAIPACTYCSPQIASIGLTERACKEQGLEYSTGIYQLKAHGKAIAVGSAEGIVKLITSKPFGEILGAHILGKDASELIAEMGLAKRLEATAEDIISTMHAHPTMAESLHEAALASEGRVIHG
jgi:dihydrolipoamide dehydrogenase